MLLYPQSHPRQPAQEAASVSASSGKEWPLLFTHAPERLPLSSLATAVSASKSNPQLKKKIMLLIVVFDNMICISEAHKFKG